MNKGMKTHLIVKAHTSDASAWGFTWRDVKWHAIPIRNLLEQGWDIEKVIRNLKQDVPDTSKIPGWNDEDNSLITVDNPDVSSTIRWMPIEDLNEFLSKLTEIPIMIEFETE